MILSYKWYKDLVPKAHSKKVTHKGPFHREEWFGSSGLNFAGKIIYLPSSLKLQTCAGLDMQADFPYYFFFLCVCIFLFIKYFLYIHFKCYPESSLYPPSTLPPYPPTPASWPWHSPVLGHIKFAIPRGLSSQWWPTKPSSATYAARDTSSGGTG
jgi:hypothetical protein